MGVAKGVTRRRTHAKQHIFIIYVIDDIDESLQP